MQFSSTQPTRLSPWVVAALGAIALMAGMPAFAQTMLQNWQGIAGPTGNVPPDVHGAPGPNGAIAVTNLRISYFTKTGGVVWGPVTLQNFWTTVGNSGNGNSDPKAIFDARSRRFFVILQENTGSRFWLNVAVSRNADPRTSGAADWLFYRLDATEYAPSNTAGGINYGGDYPGLAVDYQALYVTFRMYGFTPAGNLSGSGSDYLNTALLILDKNSLLNGPGTLVSLYQTGFGLQPVTPVDGTAFNAMFMVNNTSSTQLGLVCVADPLGTRTVTSTNLTITNRGTGPTAGAPQSGSATTIPMINRTMGNASYARGDIWACASRGVAAGPAVAAFYRVRLNTWPTSGSPTLIEDGVVGNSSEWNFCPAIGVNMKGDVAITWTRSSASIFPSIAFAFRDVNASNFGATQNVTPTITLPGPPPVVVNNTFNVDGRWGDYFSVWSDPNDGSFWATNEWTRTDTGTWRPGGRKSRSQRRTSM